MLRFLRTIGGHRRMAVAGLLSVLSICGSGTAWAYWRATGTGTVGATAGQLQAVTVVAIAGETPAARLVPGGAAADVVVKITNQNAYAVTLVAVSVNGTITAGNGCAPTGVHLGAPTNLPLTLPPGTSVSHLAGAATMDATSAAACQGTSFAIPLTITVHR